METEIQPNRQRNPALAISVPRRCAFLALVLIGVSGGCAGLRLPAIDPTGNCLFTPTGGTTAVRPPCLFGDDGLLSGLTCRACLGRPGGCTLCCLDGFLPEPAFRDPPPPPPCIEGQPAATAPCPGASVPGAPCSVDCTHGPPAVIVGKDCHLKDYLHLPNHGERGRLLLSPNRVIAPVGGEVVLLSGVCGNDGYLQTGEPIEWMLTPESVGHFIQVAPDDANLLQRMASTNEVEKVSGSFARGVTRTKPALITRGTLTQRDDVPLEAGQAWATISSPTEGVSRITALAPESDCWDQRRATTTIYWIDAQWTFPSAQIVRAGTSVVLSTRVTRSQGSIPAVGWRVKYTILNPELAGFGAQGVPVYEAVVDDSGNAVATLNPFPNTAGTATIHMEVIRPAGQDANIPALPIASGTTLVTWTTPRLEITASAPAVASFDTPVTVNVDVANPGDMPTGRVDVTVELPPGVTFVSSNVLHYQSGNTIVWTYENGIPAGVHENIALTVTSRNPFQLQFTARDVQNSLTDSAAVRVDVYVPSLSVAVRAADDVQQVTAGESVKYLIDVTNTGSRPLTGVALQVVGDSGMSAMTDGSAAPSVTRPEPLQPGETWKKQIDYVLFQSGQRCLIVTATADGQTPATAQACVVAINPIPETPAVESYITGLGTVATGSEPLFRFHIQNTGRVPLENVTVAATYPSQLEMLAATTGFDDSALSQYQVKWLLERIEPGQQIILEARFQVVGPPGPSQMILTVDSPAGAQTESNYPFTVVPGSAAPVEQPEPAPPVNPSGPPPRIPSNPTGPAAPPLQSGAAVDPATPPAGQATGPSLQLSIFDADDPVRVGDPIRYRISISNRANGADSQVQLRFALASDLEIVSLAQEAFPGVEVEYTNRGGAFYVNEIATLRAGETVDFVLVLRSNSPQTAGIRVEASSRLQPQAVTETETTTVLPQ